jgi:hypothetical protein
MTLRKVAAGRRVTAICVAARIPGRLAMFAREWFIRVARRGRSARRRSALPEEPGGGLVSAARGLWAQTVSRVGHRWTDPLARAGGGSVIPLVAPPIGQRRLWRAAGCLVPVPR